MGANKTWTVAESITLLPFLLAALPEKGRNKVKGLLTHRMVSVDGKVVTRHDHLLKQGQLVEVSGVGGGGAQRMNMRGVRILLEDDHLLVIDKPAGLLSIATDAERERTAYHILTDHVRTSHPEQRVFVVHRLDRETSGVMMFAKSEAVQQALQNAWKDMVLERRYVAAVEGKVSQSEGTITTWLKESKALTVYVSAPGDGQKATTHYRVIQSSGEYSLVEVWLETGKKNQIRVHMQSIGHSIVGDKRYGSKKDPLGRLGLHAQVLRFRHPVTAEILHFDTGIPAAFRKLF